MNVETNVKQAVPFFGVSDIEESLRYYVDGLGSQMTKKWIDEGKLRWCWLEYGGSMPRGPSSGTRCGSHL